MRSRRVRGSVAFSEIPIRRAEPLECPLDLVRTLILECTKSKDLSDARKLLSFIAWNGLESSSAWGGRIISLFASCGSLEEAGQAFFRVVRPNLSAWYSVIGSLVELKECRKALEFYEVMVSHTSIEPDRDVYIKVLKACSLTGIILHGLHVHERIIRNGLEQCVVVSNTLIDMYGKCGWMDESRRVFERLHGRSIVSWGAMIGVYVQNGRDIQALQLFQDMVQQGGCDPNSVTLVCILKSCGALVALEEGQIIHHLVIKFSFESDIRVETALIHMYAASKSLHEANDVFSRIKRKDMICWGAMISAYVECDSNIGALKIFEEMQENGLRPDRVICMSMLKACQNIGSVRDGKLVHDKIIKESSEMNITIGNALISMYEMCGTIDEAYNVFHRMSNRDIVSWTSMIGGFVHHEYYFSALNLFGCMHHAKIEADKVTYLWTLKSCGNVGCLMHGRFIHDQVIRQRLDSEVMVGCTLVEFYGTVGSLREARTVFDSLPVQNLVAYGIMISAYARYEHDSTSLELFNKMKHEGIQPDEALCVSLLRVCGKVGVVDVGRLIHCGLKEIASELNETVVNALIDMYLKCGCISEAFKLFSDTSIRSPSCWSTMISGYVECGHVNEGLALLEQMQEEVMVSDNALYITVCKAYGNLADIRKGRLVHNLVIKDGLHSCLIIGSALIELYSNCSYMKEAQGVFDSLPNPDVVCWGTLLFGYVQHGQETLVLELFATMQEAGVNPDRVIFLCVLKSCSIAGNTQVARVLHQQIIECVLDKDGMIVTALIDMYGKSGKLMDAHNLLGNLQTSSEVPFVAMIASYIQHGHVFQALELFDLMKDKGMKPGITTYLCILKGCSDVGALQQGRIIHDKVVKNGLEGECFIGNTLVDMYGKCGSLREAHNIFDQLSKQDIVSWSAMITSYASHGVWDMATQCLKSMGNCGVKPDESLFVSILSACSQNGLLEEGFSNFERMKREHGLAPRVDHFNCVVDILGRRGHLNDAEDALKSMPNEPNLVGWVSLLMGCGLYGNRLLGGECFGEIKQLNCDDGSGYSLLANLCSGINQYDGIGELDHYMRLSGEEQSYHKCYDHILVEAF